MLTEILPQLYVKLTSWRCKRVSWQPRGPDGGIDGRINEEHLGLDQINFFEPADLVTFAPFTVAPESVSVVDGNICFEFTPKNAAFFRFRIE